MPMEFDGKPEELLLKFTQAPKICSGCGWEIPAWGYGRQARLICEACASAVVVPYAVAPARRGKPDRSKQESMFTKETEGLLIKRDGTAERY